MATQDGRARRRLERRWKAERTHNWFQSFRRLTQRYKTDSTRFLGWVHLGCVILTLRRFCEAL